MKIDKDILPEDTQPLRQMKYPWLELEVGDSFEMATGSINAARTNARQAGERYGRIFDARWHKGKIRVWRWK